MNTLVLISANAEWRVVKEMLSPTSIQSTPLGETFTMQLDSEGEGDSLRYFHGGWGKISAGATTQYVLDRWQPDLLVNLGTCGGFTGRIERGTIILVERTIVYDIFEQMTDGKEEIAFYSTRLDLSWLKQPYPYPVQRGLLVSADRDILADDIPGLIEKYGAVAADWESGAIAWVAKKNGIRCLILRGVTDLASAEGDEAYGNVALFNENTKKVMKGLINQISGWLSNSSTEW